MFKSFFFFAPVYKDKSFDFKLRLWEEGYWLPQVAFGKRDIAGTGLFDGEYLVASKQAGIPRRLILNAA
ncbi:YjbH domain-containing protein, partial [Bacillus sp. SS-TM]